VHCAPRGLGDVAGRDAFDILSCVNSILSLPVLLFSASLRLITSRMAQRMAQRMAKMALLCETEEAFSTG
jgi:hypothetical protein